MIAASAMAAMGWRIVVSSGQTVVAMGVSSNPTTDRSFGTSRARRCATEMAAAAISVAHRRALDVPNDLSVVGFDDTPIATTVWPELTTVRQPIAAMAEAAINLLLHKIRRPKDRHVHQAVDHLVPYVLVKRDSVAPPRKP